jgi:hypothetical protein
MTKVIMKRLLLAMAACVIAGAPVFAAHNQAPDWMHALVNVPVPDHDEKTDAVLLYSDENLIVVSADKFRTTVREVYKILRPEGRHYGTVVIPFNSLNDKVTSIHAWCIPKDGKDYEVTDKDAAEVSASKGQSMELITDERVKILEIPAPDPGNIVGYEYVMEEHPLVLQDVWDFQETIPVKEAHYSLTLPPGWEFKDAWLNYPDVKAHDGGGGLWQWTVADLKAIRMESEMPPWRGVAGQMVLSLFPPGGAAANAFPSWHDLGEWQNRLASGRRGASPEIKEQVATLTASASTPLSKMRSIAQFVQSNIRYVAIELGIGGWQPHPAAQIYEHRYGDCKDKVNLTISMLREIGVETYDVRINVRRGSVTPETPPSLAFNHSITAIRLPEGLTDASLVATIKHPKLGTLLFFDPTDDLTPFGQISGQLQANYGLVMAPTGGELVELPTQPAAMNGIRRTGKLTLYDDGTLRGDVEEVRVGDRAAWERDAFKSVEKSTDQIKPVERLLADSLSTYKLTNASVSNVHVTDQPFIWNYSFMAENYAKSAGNLLLVRPRVLGSKSSAVLETPEPRQYPVEFEGPVEDTDSFDITLPTGYVVDDLPPAIDADFKFASYHAKTEVVGNVLHYHRTFEVKELSVPVSDAAQLRKFYRIVASDERNTAVLKQGSR